MSHLYNQKELPPPPDRMSCDRLKRAGLILCGGHSRRMGRAKAWLPFGPELLLQRVVRLIAAATEPVVVVAAVGQDLPALPSSVEVVRDSATDQGPLRGLATGLAALPDSVQVVYTSATDVPFLHPVWIDHLIGLLGKDDLAIPEVAGRLHPLAAVCRRVPTLDAAEALLAAGSRRLVGLVDRLQTRLVTATVLATIDPEFATLRNLNTPGEYREALRDAGFEPTEASCPDEPTGA